MAASIFLVIFVVFVCALFAIGAALFAPGAAIGNRLRVALGAQAPQKNEAAMLDTVERVLAPLGKVIPQSPDSVSETRLWLMQAGFREPAHLNIYFGLQVFFPALLFVVCILTGIFAKNPIAAIALSALGFFGTRFMLKRMITKRQDRIRLGLPDALDLALICVEAGLGLDQSLDRVGNELRGTHPDLSEELQLLILEMRAGKLRAEALRNLGLRTGVDDIRAFTAVLIQTERFGTSIGTALRVHSDALRTERRQRAEERAAKTTIKMIPALVLFIFPVMFFVILGPVVIQILREFNQ
jgi:tight adherence protein C